MNISTATCPPLEDLAAFLDGKLSREERARIVSHLAECESCYSVFADAARFQLDEESTKSAPQAPVVEFPRDKKKLSHWTTPVAIAALLIVGIATIPLYRQYNEMPKMVSAELIQPLAEQPGLTSALWTGPTMRGDSDEVRYSRNSFRLGVQLVNLRLSLAAEDHEAAADAMSRISGLLRSEEFVGDQLVSYQRTVAPLAEGKVSPSEILGPAAQNEAGLDQAILSPYLPFGKWAATGYLSAVAAKSNFFQDKENQRFLRWILNNAEEEHIDSAVVGHLLAIQATTKPDTLGEANYLKLRDEFEKILRFFDRED